MAAKAFLVVALQLLLTYRCILVHAWSSHSYWRSPVRTTTILKQTVDDTDAISIEPCQHSHLSVVSDIIFESFYTEQMRKSPFSGVVKLKELDRLQQNFPYADDRHYMFVAVSNNSKIVGFVDLDFRPPTRRIDPPRPYLSDLVVHVDYRRKGIAKLLVKTCTEIVEAKQAPELYIRVEQDNDVAIQMYRNMEYASLGHDIFGVEDTTMLLRKEFQVMEQRSTVSSSSLEESA